MKECVLNPKALKRIKSIHQLSLSYNKKVGKGHQQRLLKLIRKHIEEIEGLIQSDNRHFLVETGDLIVLCFELLLENKLAIDDILLKCFERYEKKLGKLMTREVTVSS